MHTDYLPDIKKKMEQIPYIICGAEPSLAPATLSKQLLVNRINMWTQVGTARCILSLN